MIGAESAPTRRRAVISEARAPQREGWDVTSTPPSRHGTSPPTPSRPARSWPRPCSASTPSADDAVVALAAPKLGDHGRPESSRSRPGPLIMVDKGYAGLDFEASVRALGSALAGSARPTAGLRPARARSAGRAGAGLSVRVAQRLLALTAGDQLAHRDLG